MKKYKIKRHFLHKLIWKVGRIFTTLKVKRLYKFECDKLPKMKENFLVVSNHTTEHDMYFVGGAFKEQMYFVCGEHLTKRKSWKKLQYFFDLIPKYKGDSDLVAMKEIIRRCNAGYNVMIFPEGSRSFNGETERLDDAIGKLVKMCKCALVTYHMMGGYFVAPRWAYTVRRGKVRAEIKHVYSAEELKNMSAKEIADIINEDIYENANYRQKEEMHEYKGEGLAEGIENYIIKCPVCDKYETIESKDDMFWCNNCHMKARYNTFGLFENMNEESALAYDNIYDLSQDMIKGIMEDISNATNDNYLFKDDKNISFKIIREDHVREELGIEYILGYKDKLVIKSKGEEICFDFLNMRGLAMLYFGKTLLFTYDSKHYEITGDAFHACKYDYLYKAYLDSKAK